MKDKYIVLTFILLKCLTKITFLILIIIFSIKSMRLSSSVNNFAKLGVSNCGDEFSNSMFV